MATASPPLGSLFSVCVWVHVYAGTYMCMGACICAAACVCRFMCIHVCVEARGQPQEPSTSVYF